MNTFAAMKVVVVIISMIMFALPFGLSGQNGGKNTVDQYIDQYKDMAVREMKKYKIPASITLAQGILESASGNSSLATKANNHFGIKCHIGWTGKTYHMDDDRKNECFRKYKSAEESYRDHSEFLTTRGRYSMLFDLELNDYYGWAYGLKAAGYATNPRYPELLVKIIEENKLYRFDKKGGGKQISKLDTKEEGDVSGGNEELTAVVSNITPILSGLEPVDYSDLKRPVFENNKVRFIFSKPGDTQSSIADEFGIYTWQIRKYNNLSRKAKLSDGELIYLEKKRSRANEKFNQHVTEAGERMDDISQIYAVKVKSLYRMNNMSKGMQPSTGDVIRLR